MTEELKTSAKDINPRDLTEDQTRILRDVYMYRDKAEYTEEELAEARKMFDTPEKFALLRKILGHFNPEERGITMPTPQSFVEMTGADYQKYAFDMAVALKVDETIRQSLVQFYRIVRGSVQDSMKLEFEEKNQADHEEKLRTEEYEENKAAEDRTVGTNL